MPGITRLQERIAVLVEAGATLSRVEREVIAPSPLSAEQKSALRLYALSLAKGEPKVDGRPRRRADRRIARYLAELSPR